MTRRFTNPNQVEGHPAWTFGLIIRNEDGSGTFELQHDSGLLIEDIHLDPGESKHVAACRAIHKSPIAIDEASNGNSTGASE